MVTSAVLYDGKGNGRGGYGLPISETNPLPVNGIVDGLTIDINTQICDVLVIYE